MDTEKKNETLRAKSLEHYYQNIPYYREYYVRNKEKLLKYNKDYKNKSSNIVFTKKYIHFDFTIQKGEYTVYFD